MAPTLKCRGKEFNPQRDLVLMHPIRPHAFSKSVSFRYPILWQNVG